MNRVLDAFTLPICLSRPHRVTSVPTWKEHIPFAMNLVAAIRPGVLVELGTHAGDAYCAFCQAVAERGLGTRCYAIGTWRDDSPDGGCGPEVLADLRRHHDPAYGGFSTLIQSTLDEALPRFADGSVDLLHIDGLRAYDAVKHAFDGWLPKMSASGIVLLHEIRNVWERDAGVARFWEELEARFPHFALAHGHGLGVLAVGPQPPEALLPLLGASEGDARAIRAFFFELGQRALAEGETAAERARLGGRIVAASERAQRAERELATAVQRATAAEARVADLEARASALAERVTALGAENASLDRDKRSLDRDKASLESERASLQCELAAHRTALERVMKTAAWRAATRYWRARDRLLAPGSAPRRAFDRAVRIVKRTASGAPPLSPPGTRAAVPAAPAPVTPEAQYALWLERNQVGADALGELRAASARLAYRPLVSVITPVYDIDETWLRRCIESVIGQAYDRWELCLVDDASTRPHVQAVLGEYARRDQRIRTRRLDRNSGIVAASGAALSMAQGEFVTFLDHDDELSTDALLEVVRALQDRRDLDLIYSDEDKLEESGRRVEPFFKPGWSPDLLLSMNYICHLAAVRRSLLEEAGGFRAGFDGSQDYDLLLRVTERTDRILRIPKVLYHWRKVPQSAAAHLTAKPYALESGKRALQEALARRGIGGTVAMPTPGRYRVVYAIPDPPPRVSIIIPTRDRADLLRACVGSIEAKTTYRNYEILVVDNGSTDPDATRYLREVGERHRVIPRDVPFNWSAINNFAARRAEGDLLLFMNNDMEVVNEDWLVSLVEHAIRPGVGAVGAKLFYPSGKIQHAGVVLGIGGVAGHAFKHLAESDGGYFSLQEVVRDCSAVTGACMMVPRGVFDEVGGFDEDLRVAFNDIDFCLRLRAKGYLVVWTPFARLLHFESATRKALHPPEDEALMRGRWATVLADDPYYSPNLTLDHEDYRLRV